jgi:hypothetical protein
MNRSKPSTVVGGGEMNRATSSLASIVNSDGASVSRSSRRVTMVPVSTGSAWRQLLSAGVARAAWIAAVASMIVRPSRNGIFSMTTAPRDDASEFP